MSRNALIDTSTISGVVGNEYCSKSKTTLLLVFPMVPVANTVATCGEFREPSVDCFPAGLKGGGLDALCSVSEGSADATSTSPVTGPDVLLNIRTMDNTMAAMIANGTSREVIWIRVNFGWKRPPL